MIGLKFNGKDSAKLATYYFFFFNLAFEETNLLVRKGEWLLLFFCLKQRSQVRNVG